MMSLYRLKITIMNTGQKQLQNGNYSIKLRKKIGSNIIEEIWNGDEEKEKLNVEYFGVGDLEVKFQ